LDFDTEVMALTLKMFKFSELPADYMLATLQQYKAGE